jgi:hypothetical protein
MPHQGERVEGNAEVRKRLEAFDLSFFVEGKVQETALEGAEVLQMEHSSFTDPGEDWNKVHLLDGKGGILQTIFIPGY